jgi:hypothetical protein
MSAQQKQAKYGTIRPRIAAWDREYESGRPDMSRHLLVGNRSKMGRWDARTTFDSCSPEHAWDNGVDVSSLKSCEDFKCAVSGAPDSARYYYERTDEGENEVVLIERDGVVTTVLLVSRFDPVVRRMLRSLRGLIDE